MKIIFISFLLIVLSTILFSGCQKNEIKKECLDNKLAELGMVKYSNQDLDCNSFLVHYIYKGKPYYSVENHCADMILSYTDCDGNSICGQEYDSKCKNFYKNAIRLEIVGIKD